MRLAVCVWLVSLSGCLFVASAAEPAVSLAVNQELAQSNERQERRAQAEEAEAAELKRQRENAAIRATGDRLRAEREAPARFALSGPVVATPPERLDRGIIMAAIELVTPQVMACRAPSATGQVVVRVDVAPDGHVLRVEIASAPDQLLARCVATVVEQATFASTRDGGSFRFPFVF